MQTVPDEDAGDPVGPAPNNSRVGRNAPLDHSPNHLLKSLRALRLLQKDTKLFNYYIKFLRLKDPVALQALSPAESFFHH